MDDALTWTVHPARERPTHAALAGGFVLALSVGIAISYHAGFGALSLLFLLVSLREFFLPTRCTLDGDGVELRRLGLSRRRAWSDFRRFQAGPRAVLLSPFSRPSRLDTYRGLVLPLAAAVRERALAVIAAHVTAAEPSC